MLRNFGVDVTSRGIYIARNTLGINRDAFRGVLMDTAVTTEQAYLDLVYTRQYVDVVKEALFLARDQARITQIRIDVGASAPLDILQPRVQIATEEENLIVAVAQVRDAEDRLRAVMHLDPADWDRPIVPTDNVGYTPMTIDTDQAVAQALNLRPEVRENKLATATQRPIQVDLAVAQLPLERLARAGALPENAKGDVSFSLHVTGTPLAPQLTAAARGDGVTSGKLRGLSFQSQLTLDRAFTFALGAQANGEPIGRLDANAAVSGAELVQVARSRAAPRVLDPLLDRAISIAMDFPGLLVGRVANLTGSTQSPAEGRLQGHIALTGTAAVPRLEGQLQLHDLERASNHLGNADLYVEANRGGALLHLGIDPPGGHL